MPAAMPPIFVINLPRSQDRRHESERQLAALGLEFTIIEACDGAAIVDTHREAAEAAATLQPHLGRALSPGELGCLLSHIAALQRIVDEQHPIACVLEDDCALSTDLRHVLHSVESDPGWDLLLLGHHSARHGPRTGAETCFRGRGIGRGYRTARVAEFAMGAYAYVVTARGARKLVQFARP